MSALISVIVPVYNAGVYLRPCLDSLAAQSYQNLEILLIDDGSTDGSGPVCDEFAGRDHRVRVIHQKNAGVSAARNAGLEAAVGEYGCFLDADDVLPPDSLQRLLDGMVPGGLVSGSVRQLRGEALSPEGLYLPDRQLSAEQMLSLLFHEEELGYQGFLWNKLFDLGLIKARALRFDPAIRYNEDRLFLTAYLLHAREAVMISSVVYLYRIHAASAQGIIGTAFRPAALTELDAFERMYALLLPSYPALAGRVARLCFEKSLYWLGRIPREDRQSRERTRRLLRRNAKRCMAQEAAVGKLKLMAHCLLER